MKNTIFSILKKTTILFLVLIMSIISIDSIALAATFNNQNNLGEITCVNPRYKGSLSKTDLETAFEEELYASNTANVTYNANASSLPTITDAAISVRDNMIARNEAFTVEFESRSLDFTGLVAEIFDMAISEEFANSSVAGDYLAWQYGGYNCSGSRITTENNTYLYIVNLSVNYYTTAKEEAFVTSEVKNILDMMNINNLSQYEKVKNIHDYVCYITDYDWSNSNNYKKFSAYGALTENRAVCQGYSVLFYRLCKEAGIDTRIVAGVDHSWNIVKIDNVYYNTDATWDDDYYNEGLPYKYFLKCEAHFANHTRINKYTTMNFNTNHPMASACYYDLHPELAGNINITNMLDDNIQVVENKPCTTHAMKLTKTVAPTCTTSGSNSYTCTTCGKITTTTIPATGHQVVKDNAVAPTYEEEGKTEGSHCAVCSTVIVAQNKIAKLTVKATKVNSVAAKSKGFTVKWAKQAAATGYQIQYSTSKNFKSNTKTVKISKNATTSKAVSKLKAKKKYYARVRCYKTVNGKTYYSNWSAVKQVTTKK